MTESEVYAFACRHKYAVLSTAGPGGPESALVGIAVTPELEIVFDTLENTRKFRNLTARPKCSFVIGGWDSERTIQYEGAAERLDSEGFRRYSPLYFRVFPDGRTRSLLRDIAYFVVRPSWIRFSDYGNAPPAVREFHF